jgi:hypothetical protein
MTPHRLRTSNFLKNLPGHWPAGPVAALITFLTMLTALPASAAVIGQGGRPAGSHQCACGTACKGKCCCARKNTEAKTAEPSAPARLQPGCQVAPLRHLPQPSQPSGIRLDELRVHDLAWSGFLDARALSECSCELSQRDILFGRSIFDTPPDPPPDRLIRV